MGLSEATNRQGSRNSRNRKWVLAGVLTLLVGVMVAVSSPALGVDTPTCNGLPATIIGTDGDDELHGTDGDDVIVGLGGYDHIFGLAGNDTICGGSGRDSLHGGLGNDLLKGGPGNDGLHDEGGSDELRGGRGRDRFDASDSGDVLIGGGGSDDFSFNLFLAGPTEGNTLIRGGPGKDLFHLDSLFGPAVVDLSAGTASATGMGNYVLESIENVGVDSGYDDILIGDDRNNILASVSGGNDRIEGRGGSDWIEFIGRDGVLDGGEGNDRLSIYHYASEVRDVQVTGGPGIDRLLALPYSDSSLRFVVDLEKGTISAPKLTGVVTGIENVTSLGTIIGDDGPNVLRGGDSDDTIISGGGNDTLKGRRGDDTLEGGDGNDTLRGGRGHDTLDGGLGDDQLYGWREDDSLDGGPGNDSLDGGDDIDECVNGETVINCEGPA